VKLFFSLMKGRPVNLAGVCALAVAVGAVCVEPWCIDRVQGGSCKPEPPSAGVNSGEMPCGAAVVMPRVRARTGSQDSAGVAAKAALPPVFSRMNSIGKQATIERRKNAF
jgi:hypothetical protein